jgi:hypothetical protein
MQRVSKDAVIEAKASSFIPAHSRAEIIEELNRFAYVR